MIFNPLLARAIEEPIVPAMSLRVRHVYHASLVCDVDNNVLGGVDRLDCYRIIRSKIESHRPCCPLLSNDDLLCELLSISCLSAATFEFRGAIEAIPRYAASNVPYQIGRHCIATSDFDLEACRQPAIDRSRASRQGGCKSGIQLIQANQISEPDDKLAAGCDDRTDTSELHQIDGAQALAVGIQVQVRSKNRSTLIMGGVTGRATRDLGVGKADRSKMRRHPRAQLI